LRNVFPNDVETGAAAETQDVLVFCRLTYEGAIRGDLALTVCWNIL
jgi:hypothetical protein